MENEFERLEKLFPFKQVCIETWSSSEFPSLPFMKNRSMKTNYPFYINYPSYAFIFGLPGKTQDLQLNLNFRQATNNFFSISTS